MRTGYASDRNRIAAQATRRIPGEQHHRPFGNAAVENPA
jgi:hypothetical protein